MFASGCRAGRLGHNMLTAHKGGQRSNGNNLAGTVRSRAFGGGQGEAAWAGGGFRARGCGRDAAQEGRQRWPAAGSRCVQQVESKAAGHVESARDHVFPFLPFSGWGGRSAPLSACRAALSSVNVGGSCGPNRSCSRISSW